MSKTQSQRELNRERERVKQIKKGQETNRNSFCETICQTAAAGILVAQQKECKPTSRPPVQMLPAKPSRKFSFSLTEGK